MPYLIGVVLAAIVCGFGTLAGFDRDRAFYPTVTIVIASYYGLFAVMSGSMRVLSQESLVIAGFLAVAVAGFKRSLWLVVAALAAHGLLDFVHAGVIPDPGVPPWWPPFCLSYDVATALYLAALLRFRSSPRRG